MKRLIKWIVGWEMWKSQEERINDWLASSPDMVELERRQKLLQKKRFYISDFGYSNVREVILGEQDKLTPGQNYDKFELDNIISWWRRKATKRYEKLKSENRFRKQVELWTEQDDIQIIR